MKRLIAYVFFCLISAPAMALESLKTNEITWLKTKVDVISLGCDAYSKQFKKSIKGLKFAQPEAYYSKHKLLPNSKLICVVMADHIGKGVNDLVVNEVADVDGYKVEIPHQLGAAVINGKDDAGQWTAACSKDPIDDVLTCNISQKNIYVFRQGESYSVVVSGSGDRRGYSFVRVDKKVAWKSDAEGRFDANQSLKIISGFADGSMALVRNPTNDGLDNDESINISNFPAALKVLELMAESRI